MLAHRVGLGLQRPVSCSCGPEDEDEWGEGLHPKNRRLVMVFKGFCHDRYFNDAGRMDGKSQTRPFRKDKKDLNEEGHGRIRYTGR